MIEIQASFDDGSIYDNRLAAMLGNIPTVFYIPVNWQKYNLRRGVEGLSPDDVRDLADKFEIGSHGTNHELLTRVDDSVQNVEILESFKYWRDNHFKVKSFCYPRGYYTSEIKQKVKDAGYKSARTTKVGELRPSVDPFESHTTVHIGYDRGEYGTDWLTYARDKVKEAIKRANSGETIDYHFWGHSEEINRLGQWDRVAEFLKDIKAMQ